MENFRRKAVFLDRDGTLNIEKGYVHKIEDFVFHNNSIEALNLLNNMGFLVIVITNQAGVAKGYYSEEQVDRLHEWVSAKIEEGGAHIDSFYYCPHHLEASINKYKIDCNCRKPKTGLIYKAANEFDIDLHRSYMIGDKHTDMQAGRVSGLRTILVKTGYGMQENHDMADAVVDDLYDAARLIGTWETNFTTLIQNFERDN